MKTKQSIIVFFLIAVICSQINLSCRSVKTAVACPEISIKKNEYGAHRRIRNSHELFAHKTISKNKSINRSKKIRKESLRDIPVIAVTSKTQINKIEFNNALTASLDNTFHPVIDKSPVPFMPPGDNKNSFDKNISNIQEVKCDTVFLKSGIIIIGKVEEIGQSELKYRRCNNLTGPIISVLKSDVSQILYSNGTGEHFGPTEIYVPNQNYNLNQNNSSYINSAPAKTEGLGLAGFLSGLVGLFIASIPLGIIAVVFSGISLSKIKKDPRRFKGKGFAIAGMVLGIVDVVGMIILLGAV
jgi:hypothetical protein